MEKDDFYPTEKKLAKSLKEFIEDGIDQVWHLIFSHIVDIMCLYAILYYRLCFY